MSKIRILLAGLMVLAMTSPALAFNVTWSGDFENRFMFSTQADLARYSVLSYEGWIHDYINVQEVNLQNPAADTEELDGDSDFFVEVKYKLTAVGADDTGKVKGVLGFEFGGTKYGQEPSAEGIKGLDFAGDDNNFELRHAYTDFEAPFDPASRIRLGLQPAVYNKFVWIDNAPGIKYNSTRGNLNYSIGWFRDNVTNSGLGGDARATNDDVFAADVNYKLADGTKLNAFGIYYQDDNETWGARSGVPSVDDTKIWVGTAVSGQFGRFFYGGTAIYEFGEIEAEGGVDFPGGDTLDRSAFLVNLEGTYKFNGLSLRGGWLYTTGDDNATDGDVENFSSLDPYMGWYNSTVVFDSYANDNSLVTTPYIQDKGLNLAYLVADYAVNERTKVGGSYLWINSAEDFSNAGGDKDLGNEFNVFASYLVTKNLSAGIQAGYLVGGDAWNSLAESGNGDDVFRTDANIRLRF